MRDFDYLRDIDYLIEKSILTTIIFPYNSKELNDFIYSIDVKEDYFQDGFHKLVAKQINTNKAIGLSIQEEFITEAMVQNKTLTNQMLEIISANPFGLCQFKMYWKQLTRPKLSAHWDI